MENRICILLPQFRNSDDNHFIGKFYRISKDTYSANTSLFLNRALEFLYYECGEQNEFVFFGYGKIVTPPFKDNNSDGFFVEISDYKTFSNNVTKEQGIIHVNTDGEFNSVPCETLDSICLDGGILLNFKADAHLVEVLGEQLIESEKVGILELIKNSLDAGASYCNVYIEKVANLPDTDSQNYKFNDYEGPVIVIEDDGLGMSKDIIENGWLRPATSIKTNIKQRIREEKDKALDEGKLGNYQGLVNQLKAEYKGRIPLGEKGVGRFATHRLGRKLIIKTKTADIDYELVLRINWDEFNLSENEIMKDLSSVNISLSREPISRDYGQNNAGTQLIIYGGRPNFTWNRQIIEEINYSINLLNSPNPNPGKIKPSFLVNFICPQVGNLPKEPFYKDFTPIFTYYGLVNDKGIIESATIQFNPPNNIPLSADVLTYDNYDLKIGNPYWLTAGLPKCGSFYFHFDIWYRDKEWIEGPDAKNLFSYLEENGGISIYRDNILILPAEWANKTDWYGLRQKQIKQAYRLSYYHMIANIEIDQIENPGLIDKTSREGLLENRQFKDLRELILSSVNLVEQHYIDFRDKYTSLTKGITRDPIKLNDTIKQQRKLINNISSNYPIEQDPFSLFNEIVDNVNGRKERLINLDNSLKNLKSSLELIEEIQDLLKEKAAYGIAVAVSVHEIAKITANFYTGITELLKSDIIDKIKLDDLRKASGSLQSELKRLSPLRAIRNERLTEFPISRSINFAYEVFKRKFDELEIQFSYKSENDFVIYGRFGTMNQIFTNLFDNSVYWLQFSKNNPRKIIIEVNAKNRTVIIGDNGPGVSEAIKNNLFEPGYSMKIPPSGLGLYICKYFMETAKGDIYETHKRERIVSLGTGAQFTLDFENVPSRKEEAK